MRKKILYTLLFISLLFIPFLSFNKDVMNKSEDIRSNTSIKKSDVRDGKDYANLSYEDLTYFYTYTLVTNDTEYGDYVKVGISTFFVLYIKGLSQATYAPIEGLSWRYYYDKVPNPITESTDEYFKEKFGNDIKKVSYSFEGLFRNYKVRHLDLSLWETTKVKKMNLMFYNTMDTTVVSSTKVDMSSFDTKNVITFESMFEGSKLSLLDDTKELDISSFSFSSAKNLSSMFKGSNIARVKNMFSFDESKLKNEGINLSFMFANCTDLIEAALINKTLIKIYSFQSIFLKDVQI